MKLHVSGIAEMNTTGRDPFAMPPDAMVLRPPAVYRSGDPNGE